MSYRLEEVQTRRQRREFIELPRAYRDRMPQFVPPLLADQMQHLNPARNPFFAHADVGFWLLRDTAGKPCARISACVDQESLAYHDDACGVFGHFLAPDETAARILLDRAREFLRRHGMQRMRGPIELSTNYTCGLQIGGYEHVPRIDIPQHPPEQRDLIEAQGLDKGKDLLCFQLHRRDMSMDRLERGRRVAEKRTGVTTRNLDVRRWDDELETLHSVYIRCWEKNYAFAPMTRDEFFYIAKNFKKIYVDGLCQIASIDGEPVGFILGLPDVNVGIQACDGRLFPFGWLKLLSAIRRTDRFRVLTLGVLPEYRGRGLDSYLITSHIVESEPTGYSDAELSWVLEDNVGMVKPIEAMGGRETIRLRLYEQAL